MYWYNTYQSSEIQSIDGNEPITAAKVKDLIDIDGTDYDTKIGYLITQARVFCENYTNISLIQKTVIDYHECFPNRTIYLRWPYVDSVTSVKYADEDGNEQTFASSNYTLDLKSAPARVVLNDDASWPDIDDVPNAVYVEYQTEASVRAEILGTIEQAIAMRIDAMIMCTGDRVKERKTASEYLLDTIKIRYI